MVKRRRLLRLDIPARQHKERERARLTPWPHKGILREEKLHADETGNMLNSVVCYRMYQVYF